MKIEKTKCPYCGASLKLAPGQKTAECEYCGNSMMISDAESSPYRQDSARMNQQSYRIPGKTNTIPRPEGNKRRKHALFPPPGFRSRNIGHMIAAVIGYLFILYVAKDMSSFLESVFFTLASLSVVDLCTNWTGVYSRFTGLNSSNTLVRIVMTIFWSIVIFIAWVLILVILEEFVRI